MKRKTGVLTVSDGCAAGKREDVSGRVLADSLIAEGYDVGERAVVPDDVDAISATLRAWCDAGCELILTTGGTGFAPRDVTPEATRTVIERDAPGLAELIRSHGYGKLPRAVLSRGVAGIRGRTLIVNLPGSTGGVRDGLEVLLPLIPHALAVLKDEPTDHTPGAAPVEENIDTAGAVPLDSDTERIAGAAAIEPNLDRTPASVLIVETNLDDLSPEFYEIAMERLFAAGAVDVFTSPITMKKNRPATKLTVIAPPDRLAEIADVLFRETTTFGIRYTEMKRVTLTRRFVTVTTQFGDIRIKIGERDNRDLTATPEYEDVKAAAIAHNVPARTVYAAAVQAYAESGRPG